MAEVAYVRSPLKGVDLGSHPFPLEKYEILERLLREELHVPPERFHPAEAIEDEDLARIHTPRYLDDLAHVRETWATLSSELPVTAPIIEGFRRVAGASATAVRLALHEGVGFCIGGGFHHAFPDHAEGFCYFHDMAIAVEKLRAEEGVERVLFVDADLHQGNGTAVIYAEDPDTFTYSIHQERNYPVKQRSDFDRGLDDGTGDEAYLSILQGDLEEIDSRFPSPDLVCYVAGVDPHRDDALGGLALSTEGLQRRDEMVLDRYVAMGIPVAVFLAGGYVRGGEGTARLHLGTARAAEQAVAAV